MACNGARIVKERRACLRQDLVFRLIYEERNKQKMAKEIRYVEEHGTPY